MIIKTPSGYEVHLKDEFTFGDYRKLIKFFLSSSQVDFDKTTKDKVEFKNLTADKFLEYQEAAVDLLVVKIIKDNKEIVSDFKKEIDTWSISDGEAVYNKISEILNIQNSLKKK